MIGDVIGNFRVVKRLGSGGMGEVFLAEHKDLQTPVAVKLLNRDISNNTDHVQRFFNEARIVSKIKSAGTVKIFDSGFHDGQAYLIMELLDGESLASRISTRGAMPVEQVIELSRQITSVLDATHRQGVIHRDLKPDNIFIVHDDERDTRERVKILDFGIAKLSGTLAMASPKTSGTMGTPAYMAPEQWGDSSMIDWRADAYSLGCVMFEMTCGHPPFRAENIAEAFVKHATGVPPTPSSLVAGVPPAVDQLILRLLAKDPAERCVSMGQVTRELAELSGEAPRGQFGRAASQPAVSPTPPAGVPTGDPLRTNPAAHPAAMPMSTATTLGGSAAELHASAPRKRPLALVAGIGTVAVAMVVVVIVMSATKRSHESSVSPAPASQPETAPAVVPVVPAASAAEVAPAPAVPAPPVETEPAATQAAAVPAEPPVEVKRRKTRSKSVTTRADKTTTATSATTKTDKTTTSATTKTDKTTTATSATTKADKTATTTTKTEATKPTTTTKPADPAGAGSGSQTPTTGRRRFGGGRF